VCTVTLIEHPGGYRLVTNRDVSRERAEADPPAWHELSGGVQACWPMDPDGGGTWVGVNDRGLTLCLLNRNPEPAPAPDPEWVSRGGLIPRLLATPSAPRAIEALLDAGDPRCAPFRLIAVDRTDAGVRAIEAVYELGPIEPRAFPGGRRFRPLCWASSGLGDSKVQRRVPLFEEMVARDPTPAAQDAFHRHRWADHPELSVLMARPDARTVSITTVEVHPGTDPEVSYEPVPTGL